MNRRGRKSKLGPVKNNEKYSIWKRKLEGKAAILLMVTFAYPSACYFLRDYTVKKASDFLLSHPGCQSPNSPWPGIIKLFPARERLVSDIPDRNGKIVNPFLKFTQYRPSNLIYVSYSVTSSNCLAG
jgi:hypothetical protein